jgi:hypothetical protein
MRARLNNGEVVTLAKDCACPTHEGPHWVYVDERERAKVSRALKAREVFEHIFIEQARLQAKAWHMNHQGIVELIPDAMEARP